MKYLSKPDPGGLVKESAVHVRDIQPEIQESLVGQAERRIACGELTGLDLGLNSKCVDALNWTQKYMTPLDPTASIMNLGLWKKILTTDHYSYPRDVVTSCDNSKPYYFWMSAYMTREMVKQGISPEAAAAGAFSAQKGYEVLRMNLRGSNENNIGKILR